MDADKAMKRLRAILAQRCPVCLRGPMFRGVIDMYELCPECGHRFMREPGFFQGAMYVSYVLGIGTYLALLTIARALLERHIGLLASAAIAAVAQLLLLPVLFRYSRVVWAHVNVGTGAPG